MTYKRQGVGPQALGSPLKKAKNPPAKSTMIPEVTVTAKLPNSKPSLSDAFKYVYATGDTAKTFSKKQHPSMKSSKVKPIMGNPPMVGGGKIAAKGFQLAKKAQGILSKYAPKAAGAVGDAVETKQHYDKIKGKFK